MSKASSPSDGPYRRQRYVGLRRLLVVLLVLALLVLTGYSIWNRLVREAPATTDTPGACPSATATAGKPSTKPAARPVPAVAPQRITVNIYNATNRSGLASGVASQLRARGFKVNLVTNDPLKKKIATAANLHHGANGAGAFRTVAAQFIGAKSVLDKRKSAVIDIHLGDGYAGLRSPAQAAALLNPTPASAAC